MNSKDVTFAAMLRIWLEKIDEIACENDRNSFTFGVLIMMGMLKTSVV